jgi:phosphoribosylanthranilate isomerase
MSVRVKICGVTRPADARAAADLGVDAVGLNFYTGSVRGISPATARAILQVLSPFVEAVGVFVNEPFPDIFSALRELGRVRTFQWHGTDHQVSNPAPFQYIPAFSIHDAASLDAIRRYLDRCGEQGYLPSAVLVDAHVAGQYGGTGRTAPWTLLAEFQPEVPLVLAGGLTAENVAEAIRIVRPYAVDVATGVEGSPGRKDAEKIRRFIGTVRETAAGLGI